MGITQPPQTPVTNFSTLLCPFTTYLTLMLGVMGFDIKVEMMVKFVFLIALVGFLFGLVPSTAWAIANRPNLVIVHASVVKNPNSLTVLLTLTSIILVHVAPLLLRFSTFIGSVWIFFGPPCKIQKQASCIHGIPRLIRIRLGITIIQEPHIFLAIESDNGRPSVPFIWRMPLSHPAIPWSNFFPFHFSNSKLKICHPPSYFFGPAPGPAMPRCLATIAGTPSISSRFNSRSSLVTSRFMSSSA